MKQDNADIFVPRVSPRPGLLPTPEKLNSFLEEMKKEGALMPFVNGMGKVRLMLIDIDAFEQRRKLEPGLQDLRERMVFGVLRHTRIINEELLTAVSQFLYQLHVLAECDFESPAEFIASAENTMKKLKRNKIDDIVRMERLTEMIKERRNILSVLDARWADLTGEIRHIVDHVRENLLRIETLCRKSIVVLVEIGLEKKKENELIEEIRKQFLKELKSATGVRQLTGEDLQKAKAVGDRLTKKLSDMIRDDQYSLSRLYEVVHDRAKASCRGTGRHAERLWPGLRPPNGRESLLLYQKIGQVLISLIVDSSAELRPGKLDLGATRNANLMEKRRNMIDHLLDQAGLERRERSDRRARQERRKAKDPNYSGSERRAYTERRTRVVRRARVRTVVMQS